MPKPFKRVILFGRHHRTPETLATLQQLITYLSQNDIEIAIDAQTAQLLPETIQNKVTEDQFHQNGDLIIVVGGDGSLLSAARVAAQQDLPVLGINRGRLGFLTDISPEFSEQINTVLQGHYQTETRFLLQAQIDDTVQIGLNDVVLLPGENAQMIEFSISIDDQLVCQQRADGLIIATPTGSTAYALSGGGPILSPTLNAIVLVPMFPHKLTSRPIVIDADSKLAIRLENCGQTRPRVSADGQTSILIEPKQTIYVQKGSKKLQLIHPLHYQYFATLRNKLQWEQP